MKKYIQYINITFFNYYKDFILQDYAIKKKRSHCWKRNFEL